MVCTEAFLKTNSVDSSFINRYSESSPFMFINSVGVLDDLNFFETSSDFDKCYVEYVFKVKKNTAH
jgi:hypothetical protein